MGQMVWLHMHFPCSATLQGLAAFQPSRLVRVNSDQPQSILNTILIRHRPNHYSHYQSTQGSMNRTAFRVGQTVGPSQETKVDSALRSGLSLAGISTTAMRVDDMSGVAAVSMILHDFERYKLKLELADA